jgi:glutamate racemase
MSDTRPIGIFDSGVGGLTVVREVLRRLPHERVVYFGDTARVPYGTKSNRVVQSFAVQDTLFLLRHDVKMIVVACHTASSVALDHLTQLFRLPILGVVEPGVSAALKATRNNRVGIIGTRGTIHSKTYERLLKERRKEVTVVATACPLFVPLAEEGWLDGEVVRMVARIYLDSMIRGKVDSLILGCTHYPLLFPVIQEQMGSEVVLIDSAEEMAAGVEERLKKDGIENRNSGPPEHTFYVSDIPHQFREIGERFLGREMESVTQVDLESADLIHPAEIHDARVK